MVFKHALKVGYRHIDCAYGYGNESEVGKALEYGLNELKIPRKVLTYIYTKQSLLIRKDPLNYCTQLNTYLCIQS